MDDFKKFRVFGVEDFGFRVVSGGLGGSGGVGGGSGGFRASGVWVFRGSGLLGIQYSWVLIYAVFISQAVLPLEDFAL